MDRIGNYLTEPFTSHRKNITLITKEGKRKNTIHGLLEVDVTEAREKLHRYKKKNKDISHRLDS